MSVFIHDIATSVPSFSSDQQHIREVMKTHVGTDRKTQAIIHRIYTQSGINKRYSAVEDFTPNQNCSLFFKGETKHPGTAARNKVYEQEAKKLFVNTANKLVSDNPNLSKNDITHVITVSCTGFYAPGPDYDIVTSLDLPSSTQRFHIGFMGCYAAFPALKMALSFCVSDPEAVVLVVSTELCSLHFQFNSEIDNLLSGSVFADGAAGVIISSRKPKKKALKINDFASSLALNGEKDMAWTIGDSGFNMVLSTYVPDIIRDNLGDVIEPLFEKYHLSKQDIDHWAIHPGGRAILDKIEHSQKLDSKLLSASRNTLANFGNMSSATILFVLKEIIEDSPKPGENILSVAFGPGLTIESGLLSIYLPS